MSTLSNTHTIEKFDSATSKALTGQRLAKVTYKQTTTMTRKGIVARQSACASIPPVAMPSSEQIAQMKAHILAMLEDAQNGILAARYEAGATSISDEELTIAACIAQLDAEAAGDRLSKEAVVAWFNESLQDVLTVALADKLGVSDTPSEAEAVKLSQMITIYRDSFAGLAGGKTKYSPEKATKLLKVLEFADDSDRLADKFSARLTKMQQNDAAEMPDL